MECGEDTCTTPRWPAQTGFNGAALVGVRRAAEWLHGAILQELASTEPHSLECGEGSLSVKPCLERWLQRSRTRWSAERRRLARILPGLCRASTEPHSLECGELLSSRLSGPRHDCFNGAALVGVRRGAFRDPRTTRRCGASTEPHSLECGESRRLCSAQAQDNASTEPHSLECGERHKILATRLLDNGLQRSRTRWSAESLQPA